MERKLPRRWWKWRWKPHYDAAARWGDSSTTTLCRYQVADIIREALKHIPPERIVISSDCGMGREGMSRRHAQYKMVAMVLGTNIVRKEIGLPEAECLAADPRYSLAL